MATLSVSVTDDLRVKMGELDDINWSAVARKAFKQKIREVEMLKKIVSKSKMTEKDAKEISDEINTSMAKKFKGM